MTGDNSDTTLTLSVAPVSENNVQVYFDGVYQSKANYSISGTTLTFSTAPATGVAVEAITHTQTTINEPAANTVTPTKIAAGDFYFDTDTLYIDATNNRVGVGTSSPDAVLTTVNSGALTLDSNDGDHSGFGLLIEPSTLTANTVNSAIGFAGSSGRKYAAIAMQTYADGDQNGLNFYVQTTASGSGATLTEAMRITNDGDILIGTDTLDAWYTSTNAGVNITQASNFIAVARSGGTPFIANRLSSDGDLMEFKKDGSQVGSIGTVSGGISYNSANGLIDIGGDQSDHIEILTAQASGQPRLQPSSDNVVDLGLSSRRFDDIYATNGTIQTSDRNEKQDIEALTDAETRVAVAAKGLLRKFRWQSAVEEKGDEARIHFGIIAQDLQDAFTAEGLDASDYAMFISTTWWETQTEVAAVEAVEEVTDEEGNIITEAVEAKDAYTRIDTYNTAEEAPEGATERTRLGVRYSELLAFIIAAI